VSVLRAYRGLLSNRPLVQLLGGEFVSSIGDWLYLVALLIVVYQVSSDPLVLGLVGAARILPYVLLSIPAGIVADRFERRVILLVTDVARGVIMLALAGLVQVHGPLPAIVGLAVLATCFSCFFGPTIGAYLPRLVRDEHELGPANSAWSTLDNLAFVIGPAIGGLLIAASGLTLAFLLNAVSFAVVAIVLWRLPAERGSSDPARGPVEGAGGPDEPTPTGEAGIPPSAQPAPSALAELPARRRWTGLAPLAGLALVDMVAGFVFGGLGVLTVILAVNRLGGEAATGYLNAAVGFGGLVGALGSGAFVVRSGLRGPLILGSLGFTAGVIALGFAASLGPALAAMALASAGSLLTEVVSTTIFQRIVPDGIRGRALGAIATISTLAYATGSLVLPVAAGIVGIERVLLVSGVLVVAGTVLGAVLIGAGGDQGPRPEIRSAAARVAGLPIFAGVPETRLAAVLARATEIEVTSHRVVIRQGDRADRFYVILEGTFDVDQVGPDGSEAIHLRTLGPDEVFGELGLLTGAPRSATVTATSLGRLLSLDAPDLLELVSSAAEVGPRLLALHRGGSPSS